MGQYLETSGTSLSKNPEQRKLVNQIRKKITLQKICQVFNDYMQELYPKEDLTFEEYDSVFCQLLNNTETLFDVLSENRSINIYEILISMVVFDTTSEFDDKILTIFKAFDIDGGGTLDRKELSKFLQCGICGLCKMVGLSTPSRSGILEFTLDQFKIIDEDGSGTIEYAEFDEWIACTKEIQDFLCMYTGVQAHKFALWRFETEKKMWGDFFNEVSVNFCGKRYVEMNLLVKALDKKLSHIDVDIRTKLYYLFNYEGEIVVQEKQFIKLMDIWSAFSANDINNDNELDANEVKRLFWLFDDQKPTREKIIRETCIMDEDGSGTIDRLEWMAYLCSSSTGSSGGNKDYYDFELREAFEEADKDKSGTIHMAELISFLKKKCENTLNQMEQDNRWKMDGQIRDCAVDMFKILVGRKPTGKTDGMTWVEMKNFKDLCTERLEELETRILYVVFEERKERSMKNSQTNPNVLVSRVDRAMLHTTFASAATLASDQDEEKYQNLNVKSNLNFSSRLPSKASLD